MAWAYVIRASDRAMFKRCRRAWDFGSRLRQNLEPSRPAKAFDFDLAIRDALALYYFPGMWGWDRTAVLPTVIEGFFKSMERQRSSTLAARPLSSAEEAAWEADVNLGERILEHYFEWAPTVDQFEPIKILGDFEANIPDPSRPGHDLGTGDSPVVPVRYRDRSDVLVLDEYDAYWIVDHRVSETWLDPERLLLDDDGRAAAWGWQNFNLGMKVQGVIYNELRKSAPEEPLRHPVPARSMIELGRPTKPPREPNEYQGLYKKALREPEHRIEQRGNAYFRRTAIVLGQTEIENAGRRIAFEALDIIDPGLKPYPVLAWETCSSCAFRKPCMALNEGASAEPIIEASYRKRIDDEFEPGRLGGSTWSFDRGSVPPNLGGKG